ncbi:MAG TPA: GldG family protein, partial [Firmicutes bacterium]|nr:GldG family protein [Bacillota bacterium]
MRLDKFCQTLRSTGRGRAVQRGSQVTLLTVAVVAILVFGNILAARFPQRWDLTKSGLYTLAPQTKEALANLSGPVKVTAFVQEGSDSARQIEDLLKMYRAASPKITIAVVDADKQPAQAKAAGVRLYDTVVVEGAGGQRQVIEPSNMFSLGADMSFSEFRGEQALTRALLKLESKRSAVLYFLSGHGEVNLSQDATDLQGYLTGEGFTVRELTLTKDQLPADAALVVAAGPSKDLTAQEADLLKNYVGRGGKLLLLFDPRGTRPTLPHWEEVAAAVGVKLENDVVVDPPRSFFADPLTSLPELGGHEITSGLKENNLNVILPRAASLSAAGKGFTLAPLLVTTSQAWGETNFQAKLARDAADLPGPLTLA